MYFLGFDFGSVLVLLYLQLLFIKGFEKVFGDDLIKTLLQSQKLSLDATQETPVHVQPAEEEK